MFDNIRADFERFQRVDESSAFRLLCDSPGLKTLAIYRFGRWLHNVRMSPLWWPFVLVLTPMYWLLVTYMRLAFDILLDQSADIGPGLYIGHFGGVRVRNCRLGTHCSIHQEVWLESLEGSQGPVIGNRVWIGAHVRVLGPVHVGDGATVGAGALVVENIDASCLVLGNPARVMQKNFDNSSLM